MTATTASPPPLILTLDALADALGGTPEGLADVLERGHAIGAIRLLPDHPDGPAVLLPAFVAERLGVRHEPGPDVPEARPRSKAPRPRNRFREALDAMHRRTGQPPAAA
jgi:hypothetical protein